jgi:hypothetical protein
MSQLQTTVQKHVSKAESSVQDHAPIKIAVLDTGVDIKHPFIKGCMKSSRIKETRSFVPGDMAIEDTCGHGTHASASILKVAPKVRIYVAKIAASGSIPQNHNIAVVSKSSHSHSLSRIRKRQRSPV